MCLSVRVVEAAGRALRTRDWGNAQLSLQSRHDVGFFSLRRHPPGGWVPVGWLWFVDRAHGSVVLVPGTDSQKLIMISSKVGVMCGSDIFHILATAFVAFFLPAGTVGLLVAPVWIVRRQGPILRIVIRGGSFKLSIRGR